MKRSSSYPPSKANNVIATSESLAARPGRTRSLLLKVKNGVIDQFSRFKRSRSRDRGQKVNHEGVLSSPTQNIEVQMNTPFAMKEAVHRSVVKQDQNTPPNVKEDAPLPIEPVAARVQNTSPGVKESDVPPSVVVHAQDVPSGVEDGAEPESVDTALQAARETTRNIKTLDTVDNFQNTYLEPLRIFDSIIEEITNVHPYTKMALGALSCASKIVLAQVDCDKAVLRLVDKVDQVYGFILQDETLSQISSAHSNDGQVSLMDSIIGKISQQTLECAHFIRDYSQTKNFWKRAGKNIFSETNDAIQQFIDNLDTLMQNFRGQIDRDVAIFIHRTGDELNLIGMTYAVGAGLDTGKQCLPGTRTDIISKITKWIYESGDSAGRVLWLSGTAGTGKTAIAHTIASSFIRVGGLGSCYCFDKNQDAERRYQKVFSTIARDLADCHPEMRRALASAVQNDIALKNTADIVQQWDKLLIKSLGKLSKSPVGPVVIIIDALDESGKADTRSDLLRILAGKLQNPGVLEITELPNNFRFIVTSRPLRDIDAVFANAQHIRRMSMDEIPPKTAEHDIHMYVSKKLEGLSNFGDREFEVLAEKADGLFEWARLACKAIKEPPTGVSSDESFDAVASHNPAEREHLLYNMYDFFLTGIMPEDKYNTETHCRQLTKFRSVMGQILGAAQPLPIESLNAMRYQFPDPEEHYKVEDIVEHMGSLLSGTTNPLTPVRPLHATFREFLTDESCSGIFFIDTSKVQRDLAFASFRIMERGLSFNICDLKTSYLPNCNDTGLQERAKKSIPPHLSYSCQFWAAHVHQTVFDKVLAKDVRKFLRSSHEQLLFWLEALSLINALSRAGPALSLIVLWLKGHSGYEDASSTAIDVQRFIQIFGNIILHSTPHLYVSALPFLPVNSVISQKFAAKFPKTLRLAEGRDTNWTAVQSVLRGHTRGVLSVSFSQDGTRIVTGSEDQTVRLWDPATGQPVGQPWQGHTGSVNSVAFSPDGARVVTGSSDKTVRLWDTAKGQPIGKPWQGHIGSVNSVSFSRDGTRVVTGSEDHTVRLWYAATGKPDGEPWRGHDGPVNSVAFSPDGARVVTGSSDKTVRLWDTAKGQPISEPWQGHTDLVISVSFSLNGTCISTVSRDFTIRRWDTTGKIVGQPFRGSPTVNSVSFSPDSSRIVTGSSDNIVRLWNAKTGQLAAEPLRGHTSPVNSVSFSPDGTRIVAGSSDGTVWLWDPTTVHPVSQSLLEHTHSVSSASFSPNGTHIATGYLDTGIVRLWDVKTGRLVGQTLKGHDSSVRSLSFSPDGTRIVTGSWDKTVRLWDVERMRQVGDDWCGHGDGVNSVSFSPDGTRVVSGSSDKTVRMWDVKTGKQAGQHSKHRGSVNAVSFSPDGNHVVTGSSDMTVLLWDTARQAVSKPWRGHRGSVSSVSFSPDGTRVVTGSLDNYALLWDVATEKQIGKQRCPDSVNSVSFSPGGTHVATGFSDNTVGLLDATKEQLVQVGEPLQGHTGPVKSVSFSPDGTRIVSCSADGTIRLWYAGDINLPEHAVNFSFDSTHALCNTAELLANTPRSTSFLLKDDGWMVGPDNQLLFWVPPASRQAFYSPWNALVIPRGCVALDLSCMAHGSHWQHCRDPTRRNMKERLPSVESSG
ncbi:WD40 repeat-like protein [Suillus weaverae]|nr:WD40 repeat-like protein [Suillus weaverae]